MDKKELIKCIKEYLDIDAFETKSVSAGCVSLIRHNEEIIISYLKSFGGYRFPPQIIGLKAFPEVENILATYYKSFKIDYQHYTIHKSSRRFEHLSSIDIFTSDDIQKVGKELKTMVLEDIMPFFDEYKNVGQVMEKVNSLQKEDISRFIYSPPVPKIMILKRIHETNDWKEYSEWAEDIYKQMANSPNGKQHEATCFLVSELKSFLQNQFKGTS